MYNTIVQQHKVPVEIRVIAGCQELLLKSIGAGAEKDWGERVPMVCLEGEWGGVAVQSPGGMQPRSPQTTDWSLSQAHQREQRRSKSVYSWQSNCSTSQLNFPHGLL